MDMDKWMHAFKKKKKKENCRDKLVCCSPRERQSYHGVITCPVHEERVKHRQSHFFFGQSGPLYVLQ